MNKRGNFEGSEQWRSSYEANNYGDLFYALVRTHKPKTIVELGTKAGYSAYHMARALADNKRDFGIEGQIYCYDLWENSPNSSCTIARAAGNLKSLAKYIHLRQIDAKKAHRKHKEVDIVHIDLGNHRDTLDDVFWDWYLKANDLIILEGGSEERDNVEWMLKYKKGGIGNWLMHNALPHFTFNPFPSVTLIGIKEDLK